MKSNLLILAFILLELCGCKKNNEVNIFGKITGNIPDKISYSVPVNGISYFGFTESVKPDSLGNFQIKLQSEVPAFVILSVPGINQKIIVVESGEDFNISINAENRQGSIKITGLNEEGQNLYNTLPNPVTVQLEAKKFIKEPSPDSIKRKIAALKADDISRFRELLNKKEISKRFFDMISADRDCYYASLTATVQFIKYFISYYGAGKGQQAEFPDEMKKMWEDVYVEYPPEQKTLIYSHFWFEYAQNYLYCKEYLSGSFNPESLTILKGEGRAHSHNIEIAQKYLSGKELEYFIAAYIYFQCGNEEYEKEFITIFEQFRTDFPESQYIKFLEPLIVSITEFHKIAEADFGENIVFIDNYLNINSLKESILPFKGKKIYIDVWASWCEPCKQEFKNKENLMKLLKLNGIEILYISIDEVTRDKMWKDLIKYYDLQGSHIRANPQLYADLRKIFSRNHKGSFYIPWHILVDKDGKILNDNIKGASEIEKLEKEL